MFHNIDPKIGGFFLLTGGSFVAFASGFSVCLFDIDTVQQCAEVSQLWFDRFLAFGNHLVSWFFSLLHAVMQQNGSNAF